MTNAIRITRSAWLTRTVIFKTQQRGGEKTLRKLQILLESNHYTTWNMRQQIFSPLYATK